MKNKPKHTRTVLFKNKDVEVILIDWEPGSETPIHDHGESCGIIRVLRGALTEDVFSPFTLESSYSNYYGEEGIFFEIPTTIHCVKNSGKNKARSLHIYTPPLVMKEYEGKAHSTSSGQGEQK